KDIDARMDELRGELARLEAARSALVGSARASGGRSSTGARRGRRSTRRAGRARGRRGGNTRANEALALVQSQPGITIPQIAASMGIEPNYLYRVMPRLVGEGQIKRD